MKHTLIAAGSALMLALAMAGCASTPQAGMGGMQDQPTRIQVENYHQLRVTVNALSTGDSQRLGEVETSDTETFTLPGTVNEFDLQIRIDPIGSPDSFVSDALVVSPGDVVRVNVGADLDLTSVTVS